MRDIAIIFLVGCMPAFCFADGVEDGEVNTEGITDIAEAPALDGSDKMILTVDQRGNLSSTNAVATSADLAAVAASNQLAIAIQQANNVGYSTATQLLFEVAASVASSPIVFCSAELSSFVAATVFDEATARLRVFEWKLEPDTAVKTLTINGNPTNIVCQKITCGYMFTSDIQTLQPLVRYVEHLDGSNPSEWDYLNTELVTAPTVVTHEPYTDAAGTTFSNFYRMGIWIPEDRVSGFFRVVVENSAADAAGNTLDTVGVTDGYTGIVTLGDITLNIRGGYIMATGTGQVTQ